jgi:predicted PurR-regulated permease PerM
MANDSEGWFSREHTSVLMLAAATLVAFYVCYLLAVPFLPALAWGAALAIVAHPMHSRLERKLARPNLAAGISVTIVAVLLIGPAAFVVGQIVSQLAANVSQLQETLAGASADSPVLARFSEVVDVEQLTEQVDKAAQSVIEGLPGYVGGSIWVAAQLLFTVFILFYFLRDRRLMVGRLYSLLPLTTGETQKTFQRVENTIFATLYGSLVVAAVQGAMGGLIFWFLGLPAPLLWGTIMGLLAVIPTLGTFVIWGPAAVWLATQGDYLKAAALVAWGCVAIGLIDNLLYPVLVGKRLRLHPLLVFIAVVGGIAVFGMAGVVLGPVALSVTDALIEVWKRRTADGSNAEDAVAAEPSKPHLRRDRVLPG